MLFVHQFPCGSTVLRVHRYGHYPAEAQPLIFRPCKLDGCAARDYDFFYSLIVIFDSKTSFFIMLRQDFRLENVTGSRPIPNGMLDAPGVGRLGPAGS